MATTIQISHDLLSHLQKMKMYAKESYEDVVWDLVEDRLELSRETQEAIKEAEAQVKKGETVPFEDIVERLEI